MLARILKNKLVVEIDFTIIVLVVMAVWFLIARSY